MTLPPRCECSQGCSVRGVAHPSHFHHALGIEDLTLARFGGHRITGKRQHRNRSIGWEFVHVAIDDASRVAYVEILEDERAVSAQGFLIRVRAWFADRGWRSSAS